MSFETVEDWQQEARYRDHRKPKAEPDPEPIKRGPTDDGFNHGRPKKYDLNSDNIYHLVD